MSSGVNQSTISEIKDQIFLDTADGQRLNNVVANLGLFRPAFGINDDAEWRAIAKKIAFNPKLIQRVYRHVIECCVGPRYTRTANLTTASGAGDILLYVEDASDLIQLGTLLIDAGLPTEETVRFEFVDVVENTVLLREPATYAHAVVADGSSFLVADTNATSLVLVLRDSSKLPVTGYPYPLLVGKGTPEEELVLVYDNTVATNTLTISALTNDQKGFRSSFVRRPLLLATYTGRTFIRLDADETRVYPASGWLRIGAGTAEVEIVEYHTNDVTEDVFYLETPLVNDHPAAASVELLRVGATCETASLAQQGFGWEILDATNRDLKIFVPENYRELRILDVSYMHDVSPTPVSTTLAADAAIGDTVLELTSVAGMPDEAGLLLIDGTYTAFYSLRNEDATPNPTVTLAQPLTAAFVTTDTVDLFSVPYAGSTLEDANVFTALGALVANVFPGKYLYDPSQQAPSSVSTTLTTLIPASTRVAVDQSAGYTNLEVVDASLWPAAPYQVRVGAGSGLEEDLTLSDVTIASATASTLNGGVSISDTALVLVSSDDFPETGIADMAGYRVIIDRGTVDEEIVLILDNDPATETLTCEPLTKAHLTTADVELLNDTLTFTTDMDEDHAGDSVTPTVSGHSVDILTTGIDVASVSGFSNSGTAIINFGSKRISVRARLTAAASPDYTVADSTPFPAANFPYQIVLGEGLPTEELVNVTANTVGTGVLTVTGDVNTHFAGEYIEFRIGLPEVVEYQDIDGTSLEFLPPVVLGKHTIGETVMVTSGESVPSSEGFDYPFYLPPDRFLCLTYVFNLIRGAGIQVSIVTER